MPIIGNIDCGIDSNNGNEPESGRALPLNLLSMIIAYLDDPADLARACRTSRILHYMCLPTLYANVSLHSYDYIRYSDVDNRPEGSGGASPFSMGLNALVTRNVAGYVKKFRVWGKWKEHDLEECAKVGRVPDSSMMLSLLVRAAIDRMPALEAFTWELDTKMLPNVWQGLAQRQSLLSLKVQFPTLRLPRLSMLVPPIPSLRALHVTNIDPLCYPDNISLLLFGSKKLEDLKLHWNPRMRESRELSVNLHSYFGKLLAANARMPLKHLSFQNLFSLKDNVLEATMDYDLIESYTMISSMSGSDDAADLAFIHSGWKCTAPNPRPPTPALRMLRGDKISDLHCGFLTKFSNLEKYYLITGRKLHNHYRGPSLKTIGTNGAGVFGAIDSGSLESSNGSNDGTSISSDSTPPSAVSIVAQDSYSKTCAPSFESPSMPPLGKLYLDRIFKHHGSSLRHLLLRPEWRLSADYLARLVHSCPNLEQLGLGLGLEPANFNMLRLLIPFLPKIYAIRILDNANDSVLTNGIDYMSSECQPEEKIRRELWVNGFQAIRWVGLGDHVFEIIPAQAFVEDGEIKPTKLVRRVSLEAVKDVEIWSMDKLEI
ncbi:hypothetical protein MMC13_008066 [Lambiella insularis]|nr:hypothetical protein [Lambiella insularis]